MRSVPAALFIAMAVATTACTRAVSRPAAGSDATSRATLACAVLEVALDSLVPRGPGMRVTLLDSTIRLESERYARAYRDQLLEATGLDSTTWSDFVRVNEQRHASCASLPSGAAVVAVTDSARNSLRGAGNPTDYWRAFYAAYPNTRGLTSVSAVGFSADGRQALLLLNNGCGGRCGTGHLVLLEREPNGPWRIRFTRMLWIA